MQPGDRVVFHGRKGTVEALQPAGMVDVRFDDSPHRVERREAGRLRPDRPPRGWARTNPGPGPEPEPELESDTEEEEEEEEEEVERGAAGESRKAKVWSEAEAASYARTELVRRKAVEGRQAQKDWQPITTAWQRRGASVFTRKDPPRLSNDRKNMCGNPLDGIGYYLVVSDLSRWKSHYVTMADFERWKETQDAEYHQRMREYERDRAAGIMVDPPYPPNRDGNTFVEKELGKARRVTVEELKRAGVRERQRWQQKEGVARGKDVELIAGKRPPPPLDTSTPFSMGDPPTYFLEGSVEKYAKDRLTEQFSPYGPLEFTVSNADDFPTVEAQLAKKGIKRALIDKLIKCGMVFEGNPQLVVVQGSEEVENGTLIRIQSEKRYNPFFSWVRTTRPVESGIPRCLGGDDTIFQQKLYKGRATLGSVSRALNGIASMFRLGRSDEEKIPTSLHEVLLKVASLSEALANHATWWEYAEQSLASNIPSEQAIKLAMMRVQGAVKSAFKGPAGRSADVDGYRDGWDILGALSRKARQLLLLQAQTKPPRSTEEGTETFLGAGYFRGALSYPGLTGRGKYAARDAEGYLDPDKNIERWEESIKEALYHSPMITWVCSVCGRETERGEPNTPPPSDPCPGVLPSGTLCQVDPSNYVKVDVPPGWANKLMALPLWRPFIWSLGVRFGAGSPEQLLPAADVSPVAGILAALAKRDHDEKDEKTLALRKHFESRWGGRSIWAALRGGADLRGGEKERGEANKREVLMDLFSAYENLEMRRDEKYRGPSLEAVASAYLDEKNLGARAEGGERSVLIFRLLDVYRQLAEEGVDRAEADQIIVWLALLAHVYRWLYGPELMGQLFLTPAESSLRIGIPLQYGRWGELPGDNLFFAVSRQLAKSERALSLAPDLSKFDPSTGGKDQPKPGIDPDLQVLEGAAGLEKVGPQTVYYTYNPALYRATLMFWPSRLEEGGGWKGFLFEDPSILEGIDSIGTYGVALDIIRRAALEANLSQIDPNSGEAATHNAEKYIRNVLAYRLARRGAGLIMPKGDPDSDTETLRNVINSRVASPLQVEYARDTLKQRFTVVALNRKTMKGTRPFTITNLLRPIGVTFEQGLDLLFSLQQKPFATLEKLKGGYGHGVSVVADLDWGKLSELRQARSWPQYPKSDPNTPKGAEEQADFVRGLNALIPSEFEGLPVLLQLFRDPTASLPVKDYPPGPERTAVLLLGKWLSSVAEDLGFVSFVPTSTVSHREALVRMTKSPAYTQAIVRRLYHTFRRVQSEFAGKTEGGSAATPPLPYLDFGSGAVEVEQDAKTGMEPIGSAFSRVRAQEQQRERMRSAIQELRRFLQKGTPT